MSLKKQSHFYLWKDSEIALNNFNWLKAHAKFFKAFPEKFALLSSEPMHKSSRNYLSKFNSMLFSCWVALNASASSSILGLNLIGRAFGSIFICKFSRDFSFWTTEYMCSDSTPDSLLLNVLKINQPTCSCKEIITREQLRLMCPVSSISQWNARKTTENAPLLQFYNSI